MRWLLLLSFITTISSCSNLPKTDAQTTLTAQHGPIAEASPPLGQRLIRAVKIRGQVLPRERKICASATVLGVGPEVCLGLRIPGLKTGRECNEKECHEFNEPLPRPEITK